MPTAPTAASRLAALLAGKRGPKHFDFELWRSNNAGDELERLPEVRGATINMSNFRDHTWELTLPIGYRSFIDTWRDFVKVKILLRDGATWLEFPMGLYYFAAPEGTDTSIDTTYDLTGRSLEAILMDSTAYQGYKVAAGIGVLSAVKQIIMGRGFPASAIDFPSVSEEKILPKDFFADPFQDAESVRWLRIVNGLLAAGGFLALWCDKSGKFRTRRISDLPPASGNVKYGNAPGFEDMINGESPWRIDDENFANSVVVMSGEPDQQFVVARAENTDPNSRVSVQALQQAGRGDGRVQKDPFIATVLVTQAEAMLLAKQILRRESGLNFQRTINTDCDPRRDAREDYQLGLYNEFGDELATGIWPVVNWQMDLSADNLSMQHELHVGLNL